LIRKIARHVQGSRKLPAIGPIDVSPPLIPKNRASALPRSRSGKVCTTMASAAGNMIAPPTPWKARKITIQASAKLPFGVSPHSAEAAANTITPSVTIFLCPTVSARRPPNAKNAASVSR